MISKDVHTNNPATRWRFAIILVAVVVLVSVAIGVWKTFTPPRTSPTAPPSQWSAASQTSEGGQVTIKATLQDTLAPPTFKITMDTHAVDLDGYDLTQLAVLRTNSGSEVRPTSWDAPKGGHHREGTLTFPTTTAGGQPVIGPATRSIELVIRDVANVPERSLQWMR